MQQVMFGKDAGKAMRMLSVQAGHLRAALDSPNRHDANPLVSTDLNFGYGEAKAAPSKTPSCEASHTPASL